MKTLCRTDEKLIDEVAQVWVNGGGDAEGIVWLWDAIRNRVKEIEEERKEKDTDG
jgi:hypothetical protein